MQKQLNKLQYFNQTNEYGKLISPTLRGQKLNKLREGITLPLIFFNLNQNVDHPYGLKKLLQLLLKI